MFTSVFAIFAAAGLLAALYCYAASGFRNGDRPGDAQVDALPVTPLAAGAQPEQGRASIIVTVRNPSGTPVLAALSVRRALLPALLVDARGVGVPRWTTRGKYRPGQYPTVGVVPAGGATEFAVPAPGSARRCLLTAAVGQEGGRLRVHRLRLGPVSYAAAGRATIMVE